MVGQPILRSDGGLYNVCVVSPCEQAGTGKLGRQEHSRPWLGLF